jgi:hypothetical protein
MCPKELHASATVGLHESLVGATEQKSSATCDDCEEDPATHRCVECQQVLCDACTKRHHKMKKTKSHTVNPLPNSAPPPAAPLSSDQGPELLHVHGAVFVPAPAPAPSSSSPLLTDAKAKKLKAKEEAKAEAEAEAKGTVATSNISKYHVDQRVDGLGGGAFSGWIAEITPKKEAEKASEEAKRKADEAMAAAAQDAAKKAEKKAAHYTRTIKKLAEDQRKAEELQKQKAEAAFEKNATSGPGLLKIQKDPVLDTSNQMHGQGNDAYPLNRNLLAPFDEVASDLLTDAKAKKLKAKEEAKAKKAEVKFRKAAKKEETRVKKTEAEAKKAEAKAKAKAKDSGPQLLYAKDVHEPEMQQNLEQTTSGENTHQPESVKQKQQNLRKSNLLFHGSGRKANPLAEPLMINGNGSGGGGWMGSGGGSGGGWMGSGGDGSGDGSGGGGWMGSGSESDGSDNQLLLSDDEPLPVIITICDDEDRARREEEEQARREQDAEQARPEAEEELRPNDMQLLSDADFEQVSKVVHRVFDP